MCYGIPLFSDGKKVLYGVGTNSHSTTARNQHFNEDEYRKYEYHWWDKKIVDEDYDRYAEDLLKHIDKQKADALVRAFVKKNFNTQDKLAQWLKDVPNEWDHLMEPKFKNLAKKVNPMLLTYSEKIETFKKTPISKYNPYTANKLPTLKQLKQFPWDQVWAQVGDQVRDQVWAQVRAQVWAQVGDQVGAQVRAQVWAQVRAQVWDQVWAQVRATSYKAIKDMLDLKGDHWFYDFIKLGVMIVFVNDKAKVFGKKGKYLGEYDQKDLM